MNKILEVSEAAKLLGISTRRMHELISAGVIPAMRTGRDYKLIRPEDLEGLEVTIDEIIPLIRAKQRHQRMVADQKEHDNGLRTDR